MYACRFQTLTDAYTFRPSPWLCAFQMVVFYTVYNACLLAWSYWLYGKTMATSLQVSASVRHACNTIARGPEPNRGAGLLCVRAHRGVSCESDTFERPEWVTWTVAVSRYMLPPSGHPLPRSQS